MAAAIHNAISEILGVIFPPDQTPIQSTTTRQFQPTKNPLTEKDEILIAMLNSQGHENVPYCVCDPDLPDMPIVFSSDGFCKFTGYTHEEIEGQNCRFLQGAGTQQQDVDRIRAAIKTKDSTCVNLLNYRKDGTPFVNEFFLAPLHADDGTNKVLYVSKKRVE